ncbi:hypothetical protein [Nocardia grenadensis]
MASRLAAGGAPTAPIRLDATVLVADATAGRASAPLREFVPPTADMSP